MLVLTVAWAIWEAGFDGWALAARLIAPFVLGLGVLASQMRGLPVHDLPQAVSAITRGWKGFALGLAAPHAVFINGLAQGDGDWLHYGNDNGGLRYSPLGQLTPGNVHQLKRAWTVDLSARGRAT
jgi:quinoprotein glucose dehydrogenase